MPLLKKLTTIPFVGNLIRTKYIVSGGKISRDVGCYSVRLSDVVYAVDALIISDKELFNAHARYATNIDCIPRGARTQLGVFSDIRCVSKNSNKRVFVNKLIYFCGSPYSDNELTPAGFIFSQSEIAEIAARTVKLERTVKRPTLIDKLRIRLNKLFHGFPKEV